MDKNRPQTFDQAIGAINNAMIAQGVGLQELLKTDYSNLRTAVEDVTTPFVEKAREVTKESPFLALGGVALGAMALGYLIGRSKDESIF